MNRTFVLKLERMKIGLRAHKLMQQWIWFFGWLFWQPIRFCLYLAKLAFRQMRGGAILVKRGDTFYIPIWVPIALIIAMLMPSLWGFVAPKLDRLSGELSGFVYRATHPVTGEIAPLFAPPIQHWSSRISGWAKLYDVEPNLLATVMQIESCGHPSVVSHAGARGLFQVMPFHFASDENMLDPDTNAKRGASYLNYCVNAAKGDVGLALGCYNGGPSVINRPLNSWPAETQRYYRWGVGIYSDAVMSRPESTTLNAWLDAGGRSLCQQAGQQIGVYSSSVAALSSP